VTVNELILALLELTDVDPTIGGWSVIIERPLYDEEGDEIDIDEQSVVMVERHSGQAGGPWVELVTT
jgi:hypothetical protein